MRQELYKKIWIFTMVIMAIGLMAIYSASFQNPRVSLMIFYNQLAMVFISLTVMFFLARLDCRVFYNWSYALYAMNLLLLFLVLTVGRHALGARRWLQWGTVNFQPSELTKLILIFVLARYWSDIRLTFSFRFLTRTQEFIKEVIVPLGFTVLSMLLIFKQPDLGTALLMFGIYWIVLFASGVNFKYIATIFVFCLALVPFAWHVLKGYQKDRLLVFLNPNIDPLGAGYTIIQSKITIGSGKIFGKGWLAGTQNQLNFLPERHTDFIFSVIGEEWGLLGTLVLLSCYFVLISCGLKIAEQTKDRFGMLLAIGIVSILSLQVIINMGMVIGLFPVVGLTLPFVSYGRSSLFIFAVMMGILLNLNNKKGAL